MFQSATPVTDYEHLFNESGRIANLFLNRKQTAHISHGPFEQRKYQSSFVFLAANVRASGNDNCQLLTIIKNYPVVFEKCNAPSIKEKRKVVKDNI